MPALTTKRKGAAALPVAIMGMPGVTALVAAPSVMLLYQTVLYTGVTRALRRIDVEIFHRDLP